MDTPVPIVQCTRCGRKWADLSALVLDADLRLDGYQACFADAREGLLLLTHVAPGCGTTLAVTAEEVRELDTQPAYTERQPEGECTGQCLDRNLIEACDAHCDMAWVRHAMQCFRSHQLPPAPDGDTDGDSQKARL